MAWPPVWSVPPKNSKYPTLLSTMAFTETPVFCFCCGCDEMYLFQAEMGDYGKTCLCKCECGCEDLDAFHEIHDEITEISCLHCEECFKTSRSTWREERGKYSAFCSDKCDEEYKKEKVRGPCGCLVSDDTICAECGVDEGVICIVCKKDYRICCTTSAFENGSYDKCCSDKCDEEYKKKLEKSLRKTKKLNGPAVRVIGTPTE